MSLYFHSHLHPGWVSPGLLKSLLSGFHAPGFSFFFFFNILLSIFPGAAVLKNPPAHAGDAKDLGSILGSGRSPGVGNGNPLQYSCLENPMDRGAWWATVHGSQRDPTDHTHTNWVFIYYFFKALFIYLWMHWIFIAAYRLSLECGLNICDTQAYLNLCPLHW